MEWIKIPTDEILLSSRTDWQNMCLIKYMALYCQLERQPTEAQLSRIMNKKQLKYVLSECEVVSELVQSCIEVVSKKRNRDKLNYKNKIKENNNLAENPLADRYRSDATDKIRLDKTRKEKEIYKENLKDEFNEFWELYPKTRAGSKEKAYKSFCKAINDKLVTTDKLIDVVKIYSESDEVKRGFAKGCAAWLNDERFNNDYNLYENNKDEIVWTRPSDGLTFTAEEFKKQFGRNFGE